MIFEVVHGCFGYGDGREVLRDLKQAGRCYVKYELKQGCFHITTRMKE